VKLPDEVGIATFVLTIATLAAWFALEFVYVLNGKPSISDQVVTLFRQWPPFGMLVGLVVGLLLGHWFWRQ
jgi:hypothetical protein